MSKNASPEELEAAMLALLHERGGRTISPADVASSVGGKKPEEWSPLMQPVRRAAVKLMKEGRLTILRKGKPVDPDDFKGTYRIGLPSAGED